MKRGSRHPSPLIDNRYANTWVLREMTSEADRRKAILSRWLTQPLTMLHDLSATPTVIVDDLARLAIATRADAARQGHRTRELPLEHRALGATGAGISFTRYR